MNCTCFATALCANRFATHHSALAPRRRLRRRPTVATAYSPQVTTILKEIASFNGTSAEAKRLTTRALTLATTIPPPSSDDINPSQDGVTALYNALRDAGLLRAFAALRAPPGTKIDKSISVPRLIEQAGLPLSALSPRQSTVFGWQVAGVAVVAIMIQLLKSVGLEQYARPVLFAIGGSLLADQLLLRGLIFESAYRALLPAYGEKVLRHEAGHFLAAYLHGLAVRGYVLSASEALRAGIPGQAGTLFSDDDMYVELKRGKLSNRAIDRYSIVSMAGIAAEAINYGEAEGGESDVQALLRLLTTLQPPWTERNVRSQARWAVLESIMLLRGNAEAFEALCDAMRERKSLAECVLCIEANFVGGEVSQVSSGADSEDRAVDEDAAERLQERERSIVEELERLRAEFERINDSSME